MPGSQAQPLVSWACNVGCVSVVFLDDEAAGDRGPSVDSGGG